MLGHWSADAFLFNTFPTSRHRSTIPCSSDGRRCVRAVTKASLHSVLKRVATPRQTRLLGSHPTALVPHTPIQIREQATHNKRTRTDLDRLVRPTRNQPRPRHVKRRAKHARLGFERPRLRDVVHVLKRRARVVIPQRERPIVAYTGASAFPPPHTRAAPRTPREKDALGIDRERIDDRIVARKVEDKGALGTFPFLDIVSPSRAGCKRVLGGVDGEGADGFLVVGERDHGFPRGEIPEADNEVNNAERNKETTHRTVESMDPVITCGSESWHLTSATVAEWPERTNI